MSKLTGLFRSKIERITYNVLSFWIVLGVLALAFGGSLYDLSTYFLSLTVFIGSYMFSEIKRQSKSSSIFDRSNKSSRRELMAFVITYLWFIAGILGLIFGANMTELAAYFGAMSTFAGSYVVGKAYSPKDVTVQKVEGVTPTATTEEVISDDNLDVNEEP